MIENHEVILEEEGSDSTTEGSDDAVRYFACKDCGRRRHVPSLPLRKTLPRAPACDDVYWNADVAKVGPMDGCNRGERARTMVTY